MPRRIEIDHEKIRDLLPLYALGALSKGEREEVARHLPSCDTCPEELAQWTGLVTDLAFAAESHQPPSRLRSRLLATASSERPQIRTGRFAWLGRLGPVAAPLAAALLLVAVGLSVYLADQVQELASSQAALEARVSRQREAIQFLTSGTVATVALQAEPGWPQATGRVYLVPGESMGMLAVDHLPPLAAGRAYQLWLLTDGERDSGGVFRVDDSGSGYLVVRAPRPLVNYDALGITEEPEGGSPGPTGEKVLGAEL